MSEEKTEKEILPFFYPLENQSHAALQHATFISNDGYYVAVTAMLFSDHIQVSDLEIYLKYGIEQVQELFESIDLPILDRMRESIFQSGDRLAEHLLSNEQAINDVDFSVAILSFKNGVMYAWIDGGLNVRIYRDHESLLINEENLSQFYGSTTVETGDIFAISLTENLIKHDEDIEDYVLEKAVPSYPGLFIDYQVDTDSELQIENNLEDAIDNSPANNLLDDQIYPSRKELEPEKGGREKQSLQSKLNAFKSSIVAKLKTLKDSETRSQIATYFKKVALTIGAVFMTISSFILDSLYRFVLRKNPHQLKRFQASYQKKNLQYLLIVVMVILIVYFALFTNSGSTRSSSTATKNTSNASQLKAKADSEFTQLQTYFNGNEIQNFTQSFNNLKSIATEARSKNSQDLNYIVEKVDQGQAYEDTLFKVTPIKKVDIIFSASNIPNANIVDFSIVGDDVYAIDRNNAQILKANSQTLQFDIFVAKPELKAMNQIACDDKSCYITDENAGIVFFTIATKAFSKIDPALSNAGKDVKELKEYIINKAAKLYAFVPSQGKIIRYDRSGDKISTGKTWNTSAGFNTSVEDIDIDGNIYELSNTGALRRFYSGNLDTPFSGLQESNLPLGSSLRLTMTPARNPGINIKNRVYIADSANKLVSVYSKDLDNTNKYPFLGNYKYRGTDKVSFSNFNDIILSQDEKSLFIQEGNIIYKVSVTAI